MLSRIWYIVLAALVGAGFATAYLVNAASQRHEMVQVSDQLRRDRNELELWLRLDARSRLDAIAPLAAHAEVRGALRAASGHEGTIDETAKRRLRMKLRDLNRLLEEGRGDLLMLIDDEGEVVAELGAGMRGQDQKIDAMPLVADALRGYVRDDIWLHNGRIYRMGGRPVIDGGQYVGALVHGVEVDDDLAQRLSKRLPGAAIGFFVGNRLVAIGGQAAIEIGRANLDGLLKETEAQGLIAPGKPTQPQQLGDRAEVLFTLVTGTAAHASVGYVIARPHTNAGAGLVDRVSKEDVAHLPWLLIAGLPLILALLGIALMHLERDKPMNRLLQFSDSLSKGQMRGLPASDFRNKHRRLAEHINIALERGVGVFSETPPPRAIPLDEVLGAVQKSRGKSGEYVGFVTELPPPMAPSEPSRPKGPPPPPPGATPSPKTASLSPEPVTSRTATPTPRNALLAAHPEFDGGDDATIVAEPPEALLEAADAPAIQDGPAPTDDRHFREVFEQFVATQKECGESIDGLTFEKFARKLETTRDNVIDRHGASTVRFTVYVKDGRAAIKASPLRD